MSSFSFQLNTGAGNITRLPSIDALGGGKAEVYGVTAYNNGGFAVTGEGRSVVSPADSARLTLTLNGARFDQHGRLVEEGDLFADIPYSDLVRAGIDLNNGGVWYPLLPFRINLTECYIRTNSTFGGPIDAAVSFIWRPV